MPKNSPTKKLGLKITTSKGAGWRTIVIKGWPEVFVVVFLLIFVIQLVLLIVLNMKS